MCLRVDTKRVFSPSNSNGTPSSTSLVYPFQLRVYPERYFLVDVREPDEEGTIEGTALKIGLGPLLHKANAGELNDLFGSKADGKTILCYCNVGYRSSVASRELNAFGLNAHSLDGGLVAWADPTAAHYEYLTRIIVGLDDIERVIVGTSMALNSIKMGKSSAIILQYDGITLMKQLESKPMTTRTPPFPMAPAAALKSFQDKGGVIFVCKSCALHRGYDVRNLEAGFKLMGSPHICRWLERGAKVFTA